jgi:hypothetical protein
LFAFLVGCAALAFFVLGWRAFGLAFVLLLALLPPFLEGTRRRETLRSRTPEETAEALSSDDSNDFGTTESLFVASRLETAETPSEPSEDAERR